MASNELETELRGLLDARFPFPFSWIKTTSCVLTVWAVLTRIFCRRFAQISLEVANLLSERLQSFEVPNMHNQATDVTDARQTRIPPSRHDVETQTESDPLPHSQSESSCLSGNTHDLLDGATPFWRHLIYSAPSSEASEAAATVFRLCKSELENSSSEWARLALAGLSSQQEQTADQPSFRLKTAYTQAHEAAAAVGFSDGRFRQGSFGFIFLGREGVRRV